MNEVIEFPGPVAAEALQAFNDVGDYGINIYVMLGTAGGAWCGATIMFDLEAEANLRFHVAAAMKGVRDRFYVDEPFRKAICNECFARGTLLQHWGEPRPPLNF